MKSKRRIVRLAPYALVAAALLGWFLFPKFWLWLKNPAPATMTCAEWLEHGSDRHWLILRDCYVGEKVSTVMKRGQQTVGKYYDFFALTGSAADRSPPRLFVRPQSWVDAGDETRLLAPGESGAPKVGEVRSPGPHPQQVEGVLAVGSELTSDVREILEARGTKDVALLLHNQRPPEAAEALAALLVPLALGAAAIGVLILGRKRA